MYRIIFVVSPVLLYYLCIWPQVLCFGLVGKVVVPGPSELQSVLLGCLNSDFAVYISISSPDFFREYSHSRPDFVSDFTSVCVCVCVCVRARA